MRWDIFWGTFLGVFAGSFIADLIFKDTHGEETYADCD